MIDFARRAMRWEDGACWMCGDNTSWALDDDFVCPECFRKITLRAVVGADVEPMWRRVARWLLS